MGFNQHTHTSIRYAPKSVAGCGMIPWWVLQSEGQLTLFIKHWQTDTMISKTVRIATAWYQWQSGMSKSFLTDTKTPLPHIEARWLHSLRYGLNKANIKIKLNTTYVIPPERTQDVCIMQWATTSKLFSTKTIKILNYCRLYLHVTTVSELFTLHDNKILPYMYTCTRPPWFNQKQYMPIQPRPSSYQIRKIWQPFCDKWQNLIQTNTVILGETTGRATHFRPYRQTYQDILLPHMPIFHWIADCYWAMTPLTTPREVPTTIYVTAHEPTTWRPRNLDRPITITVSSTNHIGSIYRVQSGTTIAPLRNLTTHI